MTTIGYFLLLVGGAVVSAIVEAIRQERRLYLAQRQQIENNVLDAIDKGLISPEMPVAEAAQIVASVRTSPAPDVRTNENETGIKPAR